MSSFVEGGPAPPSGRPPGRGLVRWVCTANPFYVVSAALFLGGLRTSFDAEDGAVETWALMGGLAGYTLLLAVTGWGLVRFWDVWDDARTVLLLVVLMFLATSVTFDRVLMADRTQGTALFLTGLGLAVAVSEGVLRSVRLRLPAAFRLPYYLALGLFFLYPLLLAPLAADPHGEATLWALLGFPAAAGVVALTLLPAARMGPTATANSGSPWPWPLYPWSLFVFLGAAVPARAFLVTKSFHLLQFADYDGVVFGPYFLVPFGFAVAAVLLEIGLTTPRAGAVRVALAVPALLVALAGVGHRPDPIYRDMLDLIELRTDRGPVFLALTAAAWFYGYAAARRANGASDWLTAALVAVAVVSRTARHLTDLEPPSPGPLLVAAGLQFALGLWRRDAVRCVLGAFVAVGVAVGLLDAGLPTRAAVGFHVGVLSLLLIGAAFADAVGRLLRGVGVGALVAGSLVALAMWFRPPAGVPGWAAALYPLAAAALVALYGWLLRDEVIGAAAALILAGWLAAVTWAGYAGLRRYVPGVDYLTLSVAAFAAAVGVSWAKSRRPGGRTERERGVTAGR